MHTAVTQTRNLLVPYMEVEDLQIQELAQRQTYLKERVDAAVINSSEFPELSKDNPIKRKESVDELTSPNSRQTVKKPLLEIPKLNLETQNKFASLKETTDITGTYNTTENNPQITNATALINPR
ncbi:hypothetical protein TNIN_110941 [Trichonephila inaurata madagascariensis]|uniref:Uncharacterized protein n=1 Tax=Trichonephila inaurata madagascariensis TaxID=2747483 RepID=A0A8X7CLM1_9ARAC|nr:hypothetical protein TNIN_102751 [Trichonephila inaurata madagascariensis]GFY77539.1 hypothetical protein TNIN_110941 [Trichonephila inaurata madagascariensis]